MVIAPSGIPVPTKQTKKILSQDCPICSLSSNDILKKNLFKGFIIHGHGNYLGCRFRIIVAILKALVPRMINIESMERFLRKTKLFE